MINFYKFFFVFKQELFENKIRNLKTPLVEFYEQWRQFKSKQSSSETNEEAPLELAKDALSTSVVREFDIGQDIEHESDDDDDNDQDDKELDESELDELDMDNDDGDDDDDDDESIEEFGENDKVELTEEQMKKLQAKIEKAERKLSNNERSRPSDDDDDDKPKKKKRKRSKKNRKKARGLNPNLDLEGAFDLSSDEE